MRNPTYENALERQGVTWDYQEKVGLIEIDLTKGLRNQARLEMPVDEELVSQYQAALQDKAVFPPVVLGRTGKGRWIPVDGNQRLAAYTRAGWKFVDAYLLRTQDPVVLDRLTWCFNNLVNGKRLTKEECLQHAVTFVRKYGMTHEQAAKEWGLAKWQVTQAVKALELQDVLDRQGVKRTPTLTDDKLHELAPLLGLGEDVLAKAATVVATTGISEKQIVDLNKKVKAARTHDAKLEVIDTFAQSPEVQARKAETKGGRIQSRTARPSEQLIRLVQQAQRLVENYDKAALRPVGSKEFKAARIQVRDLTNRLIVLFGLGALLPEEESA